MTITRTDKIILGALAGALLLVVLWIDLGPIHRAENADSLLSVLISCMKWTPYYWEQNRLGMLVPLLAMPFRDPFVNLLVQRGISLALTLAAFFIVMRYFVGPRRWVAAGAVAVGIFLLGWHTNQAFYFLFFTDMYGIPLGLGFAAFGLIASEPQGKAGWRSGLALALLFVATWSNIAIVLSLGPILFAAHWLIPAGPSQQPSTWKSWIIAHIKKPTGRAMIALVIGFAFGMLLARYVGTPAEWNQPSDYSKWFDSWALLLLNSWRSAFAQTRLPAALAAVALCGALTLFFRSGREMFQHSAPVATCLLIGAASHWMLMGMSRWVIMNDHDNRYMYLPVMLLICAVSAFAVMQLSAVVRQKHFLAVNIIAIAALWFMPALLPGFPSIQRVRDDLDRRFGKYTAELISSDCTHVYGEYWIAWPTVFHANMVLHGQGNGRKIWGLSYRSKDTKEYWDSIPRDQWRVGHPIDEKPNIPFPWLPVYGIPTFREVRTLSTIRILEPSE